ncbi:MAG: hypothetical protein HPY87_10415 [Fervidobacterium sp.]|uniref:hypothetical protein n=1 Tax=Fervidobacterium sp. TaxID=1871331 RepID=UPI0025B8B788|nr:hypothetical protein [Fervidobacterium sp.]NPU90269.1 hypothetical protein [Fervidobacterium sp.]
MARFTTEDDEGVTNFVDFHGFATLRAFRIREREEFVLLAVSKFERAFAVFAEILLIVVLIMTVFVDVGRTALRAGRFLVLHVGIPPSKDY